MPDPGSNTASADLARLGGDICDLVARSDALGLAYVAIHLCSAMEALEAETASQLFAADSGGAATAN